MPLQRKTNPGHKLLIGRLAEEDNSAAGWESSATVARGGGSPEYHRNGAPGGQFAHALALQREEKTEKPFAGPAGLGDGRKMSRRGELGGGRRCVVEGRLRWPKWLGGGPSGFAKPRG